MKNIFDNLSLATQYLGNPLAVATLAANTVHRNGQHVDFSGLCQVLRDQGFENYIVGRALHEIPSLAVPVLLFLKNEESLLITKIHNDPEKGRIYRVLSEGGIQHDLSEKEIQENYLGACWFLKKKISEDKRSELPLQKLPKAWLFKTIWRFKRYYYQVIIATFLVNCLALISSLYVMNVYDRVIPNAAFNTLWVLSIGVFLAIFFEFSAKMLRAYLTDIAGKKADLIISAFLFRRVMGIKMAERPPSAGSYASNLREFESVREFLTSASLLTLIDIPFLLLFIFVISVIAGKLAFVPMVIIPLVILIGISAQFPLAKAMNESMRESSQRQGLAVESLIGLETLKNNNAMIWAEERWDHYTAKTARASIKIKNINSFVVNSTTALQQLNTVFLVLYGTYLIHAENPDSRITMGALIASVILSGRALAPLGQIAGLATRFQQAWVALKGVQNIMEKPIERPGEREYTILEQTKGELYFQNVSFKYKNNDTPNVQNIKLHIRPGEKVGIIGKIGSGKSTLLKLATNQYSPDNGTITLDGVNLQQIDPFFLRNQIHLLEQKPHLFLGTLRENLQLANMDQFNSDHNILMALQSLGLLDMIQSHAKGLDMFIGEDGQGLSGGQKQTIALARMLMRNPRIALLDEPTAELDNLYEQQAIHAIGQWAQNRTLVIVSHRTAVLRLVDRLILMENGQIIMDGPRDEVLNSLN